MLCNAEEKCGSCLPVDWSDQRVVSLPVGEETVLMHVNVQQTFT